MLISSSPIILESLGLVLSRRPTTNPSLQTKTSPPESPTTVRPFEMDDDDVADTSLMEEPRQPTASTAAAPLTTQTATTPTANSRPGAPDDAPPPKPPRPLTEAQKNESILKEAFPSVNLPVIKAILTASSGNMERAINALLGTSTSPHTPLLIADLTTRTEMTDPDAVNSAPPPQPPRPNRQAQSQLEEDERYARQLAEHYENVGAYEARTMNRTQYPHHQQQQQQPYQHQNQHHQHQPGAAAYPPRGSSRSQTTPARHDPNDREYSFIDDDLPAIRENLRKGFVETQSKLNGWIREFKKKIDETFDDDEAEWSNQGRTSTPLGGRSSAQRSSDYHRYDADPEVLSDDFAGIKLAPDGSEFCPRPKFV